MGFGIAVSLLVKCCLCEDMHFFLPYGGRKIEYIVVVPSIGIEVMLRVDSVSFTGCQKGGSGAIATLRLWQPASIIFSSSKAKRGSQRKAVVITMNN